MAKLMKYFAKYWFAIIIIIALLFAQAMADLTLPDFMSEILDKGIIGKNTDLILMVGMRMLFVSLLSAVCAVLVGFFAARVAANISKRIRNDIFAKVQTFSSYEFEDFTTASLITRSTNDIQQMQMFTTVLLRLVFLAPIMGIGAIFKAYQKIPSMTWTIGVALILIFLLLFFLFKTTLPKYREAQDVVDNITQVMGERLTGMLVVRAFVTGEHEKERFDKVSTNLMDINKYVNTIMVMMMPVMMLIMNGISLVIVWFASHLIELGTMQVGDMVAFMQYTMQTIMAFVMISMIFIMMPRALVSGGRIAEVLETEPTILDPNEVKSPIEEKKGLVEFKNVSFRFPDADEDVISDITFTARPGETTAIIGSTGSGKSTILNLIPRFYDVGTGDVLVNGISVKEYEQQELRKDIGYVPQKGTLFSGTIDSNLRFGKDEATKEEIEKAAMIANATEFIEQMPSRYETSIAQGGTNVSGGQKQRLSIARALVKEPQIYLFDDSFSALDFRTDRNLRQALKENVGDATLIIVAQRVSTIQNANQIIVLDDGKIVGTGTHSELMETCAVYKEITVSQMQKGGA